MRKIKAIHKAISAPIDDLITYRAMPSSTVNHIDPFLFLNHHGPQTYGPNNNGLPFAPHPHRGFETLTFVIEGDVVHKDSGGGSDRITAGGVQWMTAGKGLIHSEVSSEEFKKEGGEEELLQLWMNLPAKHKMTEPEYIGLQYDGLTHFSLDDGLVKVNLISGNWEKYTGPLNSITGLTMSSIEMKKGGSFSTTVPESHNVLFYIVRGSMDVNREVVNMYHLVEFANDGEAIKVKATEDSILLFGHGEPFNEPIVAQGPFVMNSQEEIMQAYEDFRSGKMGTWGSSN